MRVGIFAVQKVPTYPHVAISDLGGVIREGQVWFRRGTKNTVAHRDDLERMIKGDEAFKFAKLDDPRLKEFEALVRSEGYEPSYPDLANRELQALNPCTIPERVAKSGRVLRAVGVSTSWSGERPEVAA